MHPKDRQATLIARHLIIDDPHERLAAITSRNPPLLPLLTEERRESALVPGCISRVWLACSIENGRCRFRVDCESPMVRGLVRVLCEIYDDTPPEEIAEVEPTVFEVLGIAAHLTPTRLNGLANVRKQIREFAQRCLKRS
jgi:cysteine desulfuration protein SufE